MINEKKITAFKNPVKNLADQPQMSADNLKEYFDSNSMELKDSLNGLIDELMGESGAENIGLGNTNLKQALEEANNSINHTYNKSEADELLFGKVDKEEGKGLTANDFTNEEKLKLAGLPLDAYSKTEADDRLEEKVDKAEGKGLSSNDYTGEEKEKLSGLPENVYSKDEIDDAMSVKVNEEEGKGLSSNDYTNEEKQKLLGLTQNLPEIEWDNIDDALPGIYRVKRTVNVLDSEGEEIYSNGYAILITENYVYYWHGEYNESGYRQTLYDTDGSVKIRHNWTGGQWEDWREYIPNDTLKVDKVSGMGLSEENYSSAEKEKLAGLPESILIPKVTKSETSGTITVNPNEYTEIPELTGATTISLGTPKTGYDNTYEFEITQGATAQTVALPTVKWTLGIAPTFSANTTTICMLYYVKNTLCGAWEVVINA